MSKAPKWIYLDGDVKAGDGMFPRCFENPKYASDPPIEYGRVDLLEAAEQRGYASAMEAERKIHADRIEELEAENTHLRSIVSDAIDSTGDDPAIMAASRAEWAARAMAAEAKLAKASKALSKLSTAACFGSGEILGQHLPDTPMGREIVARMNYAQTTLAELKGEK